MAEQNQAYRKKQAYLVLLVLPPPWSRKKSLTNTIISRPGWVAETFPPCPRRPFQASSDDLAWAVGFLRTLNPEP
jgi:hypothetical protein